MKPRHGHNGSSQRGITLIVVLILLVIVTIVGIGGARIALLGERSTRYDRDYQIAWQSAEQALMDAEFDIIGPNTHGNARLASFAPDMSTQTLFESPCSTGGTTRGLCQPAPDGQTPTWRSINFTATAAARPYVIYGDFTGRTFDFGNGIQPALKPRYIIEILPYRAPGVSAGAGVVKQSIYRITAVGFGPNQDVQVMLQTSFKKEKL